MKRSKLDIGEIGYNKGCVGVGVCVGILVPSRKEEGNQSLIY